jgi:protein-S-isoprenylcysteine O-methyltransferase Ste14
MNQIKDAAKGGGTGMTILGVITIILGMLAMMAPGLTGMSVVMLVGVVVLVAGIVRIIWATAPEGWVGLDAVRRDRVGLARHHHLEAVPPVRRMGHRDSPGH